MVAKLTLSQCPHERSFGPTTTDVRTALCRISRLRSFKKDELVFEYGDEARGAFYVLSGRVRLLEMEEAGMEDLLAFPGQCLTTGVPLLRQNVLQTADAVSVCVCVCVCVCVRVCV